MSESRGEAARRGGIPTLIGSVLLISSLLVAGCQSMNGDGGKESSSSTDKEGPERQVLSSGKAIEKTQDISSRLLDLTGVQGKVTPTGPGKSTTNQRAGNYYVHHAWSLYGVSTEQLKSAMRSLRSQLPEHGWEIERYERANSEARQLLLEAFHKKGKYLVQVELLVNDKDALETKKKEMLAFTVNSPTYKSPSTD